MSYCSDLADWTAAHSDELSRYGSYALSISQVDRPKPSAHLAFETESGFVELTVWESGEAEFGFGAFDAPTDEHHDLGTSEELARLLWRFLQQASRLEQAGK